MSTTSTTSSIKSVLLVGATGRLGLQIIKALAEHNCSVKESNSDSQRIHIHAFCRTPAKLDDHVRSLCTDVHKGDARSPTDLRRAVIASDADVLVVAVGNGDDVSKSDIREANAKAIVHALSGNNINGGTDGGTNGGSVSHSTLLKLRRVCVYVVSSNGAGPTKIKVGMGIGMLIQYHLRHVMKDHTKQENVLLTHMTDRVGFVRPTGLGDGSPTGSMATFGDKDKPPTIKTDRADLANWIVDHVLVGGSKHNGHENMFGGRAVNITCVKKTKT